MMSDEEFDSLAPDDRSAAAREARAEVARLQRRVEELEHERTMSADAAEGHLAVLVRTQKEAAEQRKRAEEAERAKFEAIAKAQEDWFALDAKHAAAIEKARQEERARIVAFLQSQDPLCDDGWSITYAAAIKDLGNAPTS